MADTAAPAGSPSISRAETSDGVEIAYATHGDGPPLVFVRGLNSHLDHWWQDVRIRRYFEALGHVFTTVRFDARGIGLSGPAEAIGIDELVDDLDAVITHGSFNDVTLLGQGFGSAVAIAYAARYPDVVSRLLLYCAHSSRLRIPRAFIDIIRGAPDHAALIVARESYPDAENIPVRQIAHGFHTDAETAARYFDFVRHVDVTEELPGVCCPTLVMQPTRSEYIPHSLGEEIADGVRGARLVTFETGAYNVWNSDSFEPTLHAIGDFIGRPIPMLPAPRQLAILVTDIVGSTAMTYRLGEERARSLLHVHDGIVRSAVTNHDGDVVKHTGDGMMATFTAPDAAVACAIFIQKALGALDPQDEGVSVRIGIAYGDVIDEGEDLFGTTVVLAVRLAEQTDGGHIVAAEGVRHATSSALFTFDEPRALTLKGFPEPVSAYDVQPVSSAGSGSHSSAHSASD